MFEFHRHSPNLPLHLVIDIVCSGCGDKSLCDMPMRHVCKCGGRQFVWGDHDMMKDTSKLKEVPYVAPTAIKVPAVTGNDPLTEVPEGIPPMTGYQLRRRQELRSFPK